MRHDRSELSDTSADFEALVARIHRDLRKQRRTRIWRAGAHDRGVAMIALLALILLAAIGLFVSGAM